MPSVTRSARRAAVTVVSAVTAASLVLALGGCSDDDGADAGSTPPATASPTAPGDRPLVDLVEPGDDARVLALDPEQGAATDATLVARQEVVADERATTVPPITVPLTVTATKVDGDEVTTTQQYAAATVDAAGLRPADVRGIREGLAALSGTTSTLVVRRDGTTVSTEHGVDAAAQVDSQLRLLTPVLPTEPVGVGGSWTATSVVDVDGATADQVVTYTLESLDGDDYVITAGLEQQYRAGTVDGVEVRGGNGTATIRFEGSLRSVLPDEASGGLTTQVTYVVDGRATEVRTTVSLELTAG